MVTELNENQSVILSVLCMPLDFYLLYQSFTSSACFFKGTVQYLRIWTIYFFFKTFITWNFMSCSKICKATIFLWEKRASRNRPKNSHHTNQDARRQVSQGHQVQYIALIWVQFHRASQRRSQICNFSVSRLPANAKHRWVMSVF